ncbi:hypothetical protein A2U01_0037329, partial [Trifolium medium]|nr:hypothetical protein [Trifolium medium]
DKGGEELLSAQNCGEKEDDFAWSREELEMEGRALEFQFTKGVIGPLDTDHVLGQEGLTNKTTNKGKCILKEADEVAMGNRNLFKGSCSRNNFGPDGLSLLLQEEYQGVKILKDVEVAQLASYEKTLYDRTALDGGKSKFVKSNKHKKGGNGALFSLNPLFGGLTKASMFATTIQEGPRGRKTIKKKNKRNGRTKALPQEVNEDSISSDSSVGILRGVFQKKLILLAE